MVEATLLVFSTLLVGILGEYFTPYQTIVVPYTVYGPPAPPPKPAVVYGPPAAPPKPAVVYGPPVAPPKPIIVYGPPEVPKQPAIVYGPPVAPPRPSIVYGPPVVPNKPATTYGVPDTSNKFHDDHTHAAEIPKEFVRRPGIIQPVVSPHHFDVSKHQRFIPQRYQIPATAYGVPHF